MLTTLIKFIKSLRQPWMKNSKGVPDAMLTFACVGLAISALAVIVSLLKSVSIHGHDIVFNNPSETLVLGFLSATLGAYVLRRNKKDELDHQEKMAGLKETEEEEKSD